MKIVWARPALQDLSEILDYIAERNLAAAARVADILELGVNHLNDNPKSGRLGRVNGTREIVFPKLPYIIAYREKDKSIEILAVRHTSRRWPDEI